jgi:hypothetical protein
VPLYFINIICYALVDCLVAPATCGAIADCLHILVASSLPCSRHRLAVASPSPRRRLAVASPSPRRRLAVSSPSPRRRLAVASPLPRRHLAPPFARHRHHHVHHRRPTRTATATAIAIGIIMPLSLPVLLPPPTPLFRPPSPLPPSPLSGCVHRAGSSGGTTTPAVIRDRPDGRTTKTRYGTASVAALAAAAATEEEECDGCDGANPRRRLDDSLLRLADWILLRSIVATTAPRRSGGGVRRPRRHPCLQSTSARCSLGGRIGRAITAAASRRRMTTTPTWKRGGTRAISWRSSSADFGKGVLGGGE